MTPEEKKAREIVDEAREWLLNSSPGNTTFNKFWEPRIALAIQQAYNEGLERAKKVTCKYCDMERPLIGDVHVWQILICKDKKGKLIYNPVQEDCLATAIRKEKR